MRANPLTTDANYTGLLSFESDIAQVVGLIVLFVESAGSLAELGAFAASRTIAPSLLAILDDFYYAQSSFVRNGPVKHLEIHQGEESILVLERDEIGISATGDIANINAVKFEASIKPAIERRLRRRSAFEKLNVESNGHAILVITGLCQEYGALTVGEIRESLASFGIENPPLSRFIYCSELLGWIKKVRKGNIIYYVATAGEPALDFSFNSDFPTKEKVRWRADIRAAWQKSDPVRMRAIREVLAPPRGAAA